MDVNAQRLHAVSMPDFMKGSTEKSGDPKEFKIEQDRIPKN